MTLPKETNMIEIVADAIDDAEVGYSLRLTSMVDGVSTYTLTMDGYPDEQFEWIDDGYEAIRKRRTAAQARAVLTALREPTPEMVAKGRFALEEIASFTPEHGIIQCWQAMIDTALTDGEG